MRTTDTGSRTARRTPIPPATRAGSEARALLGVLGLFLLPSGLLLLSFMTQENPHPYRWDTPYYVWQTAQVGAVGIVDAAVAQRPGFPLLAATLQSVIPVSAYGMAPALALSLPAVVGLAGGALLRRVTGPGAARSAALVMAVTLSFLTLRPAGGLYSNMVNLSLVAAAMLPAAMVLGGAGGTAAVILLLLAAGISHWMFTGIAGLILAVVALWHLARPDPGVGRRLRGPLVLLGAVGAAGLATLVVVFGLLGGTRDLSGITRVAHDFPSKLAIFVRGMVPYLTVPLMVAGAVALWRRRHGHRTTRFVRVLTTAWLGSTAVGMLAWFVVPDIPLHRLFLFSFPLSLLLALGVVGTADALARRGGVSSPRVGAAVLAILLAVVSVPGLLYFFIRQQPNLVQPQELNVAADVARYVDWLPEGHPVVVILVATGDSVAIVRRRENVLRSVLSGDRIEDVLFYWGKPSALRAGRPTRFTDPVARHEAAVRWEHVRAALSGPHSVVMTGTGAPERYLRALEHGGTEVAPLVAVLEGPTPPASARIEEGEFRDGPVRGVPAVLLALAIGLVLLVAGVGWSSALLPRADGFERMALAPGVGVGILVLVATAMQATGAELAGTGGVIAIALTSLAGGAAAWWRTRRTTRTDAAAPPPA
jgi:hypothetical protein